jgi:hypothetical protein
MHELFLYFLDEEYPFLVESVFTFNIFSIKERGKTFSPLWTNNMLSRLSNCMESNRKSEWLLLNANLSIFQLYNEMNKLIFKESIKIIHAYWCFCPTSHCPALSHNVVSSTHRQSVIRTHNVSGDRHHAITTTMVPYTKGMLKSVWIKNDNKPADLFITRCKQTHKFA